MANLKKRASDAICYHHYWRLTTRVVKPLWLASTVITVFITKQILRTALGSKHLEIYQLSLDKETSSPCITDSGGHWWMAHGLHWKF